MVKISVWLPNTDPGALVEVPFYGLLHNKTVVDIPFNLFSVPDGDPEDIPESLVYGEEIPKGEEWTAQTPPSVFNTVEIPVIVDNEDGGKV